MQRLALAEQVSTKIDKRCQARICEKQSEYIEVNANLMYLFGHAIAVSSSPSLVRSLSANIREKINPADGR